MPLYPTAAGWEKGAVVGFKTSPTSISFFCIFREVFDARRLAPRGFSKPDSLLHLTRELVNSQHLFTIWALSHADRCINSGIV